MYVLGIETSCDETAAAVVKSADGRRLELLSSVVVSQIDIHREFGGVVPEVAARSHIEVILPTIEKALKDAFLGDRSQEIGDRKAQKTLRGATSQEDPSPISQLPTPEFDPWDQIDAIAITQGPGLLGSLLIGVLAARTLAWLKDKPLYPINHVEAHTYANWLVAQKPEFPLLSLTVSGGHTQLVLFEGHGQYRLLGQTQDDAAGEAFDKVAKLLGLEYPGGPAIAEAAKHGDPHKYNFPKARMEGRYDFSFSGLKTAVLRHLQQLVGKDFGFPSFEIAPLLNKQQIADTAASFQQIAVETLVVKTVAAWQEFQPQSVVIAGGVAANQELRRQLKEKLPINIEYAPIELCTDNAAMIAARGYFAAQAGEASDPLALEAKPSFSM